MSRDLNEVRKSAKSISQAERTASVWALRLEHARRVPRTARRPQGWLTLRGANSAIV